MGLARVEYDLPVIAKWLTHLLNGAFCRVIHHLPAGTLAPILFPLPVFLGSMLTPARVTVIE